MKIGGSLQRCRAIPVLIKGDIPENPCLNVNCGEAGCMLNSDGEPECRCVDGKFKLTKPDANLRCNWTIGSPIDIDNAKPVSVQGDVDLPADLQVILQIAVPAVCGVFLVLVVIFAMVLRRRRNGCLRSTKYDSRVVFLQKQDSVSLLENMTVVSKNPTYCPHEMDDGLLTEMREKHVPRDKIRLLEEIGEGAFGKVFKGEMQLNEERTTPVAVKILKSDASSETRDDFRREVKIMSSFDHENILKLIGVVPTKDDSPYMIFEYMEHGDLTEVLRRNDPCLGAKYHIRLRQVYIATQIANGMVYLASRHFVHRDLATRNCLVGADLIVKIADFGMSRDIYTCDYYKISGARMLPVRWMSPESMKYGRFTTESDVWAYGVVLWETFSFGKQPYYGHANEEVIKFIEDGILLQKPNGCPETLYHVMLGCWRRDPQERFSFERIHNLLLEYERNVIKYTRQLSLQRVSETEDV
ncbi:hypothetical protein LSH36_978g00013 [Paralvinella palmiformis]|uniref:Protein kinase domain-containing protein n=1 Tax=Paralvinella palmiformis TaxID=53620 RepID=A0AAD9IWJ4_9ANNE|nr:hypothetical protein LSH36_978g00013 [Paralvinella palmiformis]